MLMKNIFLTLGFLLSALITSAQYKESDLEGGTWVLTKESDIAAMLDITISFKNGEMFCFSKLHASATDTTTIYTEKTIHQYYLSDHQEDFFDETKFQKNRKGIYIIISNPNDKTKASAEKIEELTPSKMTLQPLRTLKREEGVVYIGCPPTPTYYVRKL